jgi:hypothetical protein
VHFVPSQEPWPDTAAWNRVIGGLRGSFSGRSRERHVSEGILEKYPYMAALIQAADSFNAEVAAAAVRQGARAVAFTAAGYPFGPPHGDPPHHAAMAAAPGATFAYCAEDTVITMLREKTIEVAGEQGRVSAVQCSMRDPAAVRRAAGTAGPVMVQLQLAGQWMDDGYATWLLGEYGAVLPAGSSIAITLFSPAGTGDGDVLMGLLAAAGRLKAAWAHERHDVERWVTAAGLAFPRSGEKPVRDVRAWGRPWAEDQLPAHAGTILGAVALVP